MVINNACQTVRRPAGFFKHLMDAERQDVKLLPEAQQNMVAHHHEFVEMRESAQALRDDGDDEAGTAAGGAGDEASATTGAGAEASTTPTPASGADTQAVAGAGGSAGAGAMPARSAEASQMVVLPEDASAAEETLFPKGLTDVNEQQVDLRTTNSWLLKMDQVRACRSCERRAGGAAVGHSVRRVAHLRALC